VLRGNASLTSVIRFGVTAGIKIYVVRSLLSRRHSSADERVPERLKEGIAAQGSTLARWFCFPHYAASSPGALGLSGPLGTVYSSDEYWLFATR
jgi:hypothetical protein